MIRRTNSWQSDLLSIALVICLVAALTLQDSYTTFIIKRIASKPDEFSFGPKKECNIHEKARYSPAVCHRYNAKQNKKDCRCACNGNRETFGYNGGKWTCNEKDILLREGCHTIVSTTDAQEVFLHTGHIMCSINNCSSYMTCAGRWNLLGVDLIRQFTMAKMAGNEDGEENRRRRQGITKENKNKTGKRRGKRDSTTNNKKEELKIVFPGDFKYRGRIIKIGITCEGRDSSNVDYHFCLLFKTQGEITCSSNVEADNTTQPYCHPGRVTAPAPESVPATTLAAPSSSGRPVTTTVTTTVTATVTTTVTDVMAVAPAERTTTAADGVGGGQGGDDMPVIVDTVAGVAASVAGILIFLAAMMYCRRRRVNRTPGSR